MKRLLTLIFLFSILLTSCQQKTKNPLSELSDKNIHSLNMYFYPSTIRMINLSGDSSFYEAIKGVERLQFMTINLSEGNHDSAYSAWEALQDFEEWDELMKANMDGGSAVVYTPKGVDDQFFVSFKTGDGMNLVWAEGSVNLSKAMSVMKNGLDLGPINNFLNDKSKEEKVKEMRKKAREEQRKFEEGDSTTFDKIID